MMFHPNSAYRLRDRLGNAFVIEYRHSREAPGWYIRSGWLGVITGSKTEPLNMQLLVTCVEDGDLIKERVSL